MEGQNPQFRDHVVPLGPGLAGRHPHGDGKVA